MKKFALLTIFMSLCLLFQAQTADEILSKYYENIGGTEAWKNLQSMKMSGTSSMQGMEFPITIYSKRPNLEKLEVEVQGMQIIQAFDGTTAWSVNPFQGSTEPTKADEEMTAESRKKKFEDELIDYAAKGHTIELLGTEEIDGTMTNKIKLTKSSGDEVIYFFDQEHHIPIVVRTFAGAGPMKGQAVDTYFSDYQPVGDIILPMAIEQKVNGATFMSGTMDNIELNVEMDDQLFKFPGDLAADESMDKTAIKEAVKEQKEEVKEEMKVTKEEMKEMKEESKEVMEKSKVDSKEAKSAMKKSKKAKKKKSKE